ncbi:sulfite exporter TauE/SafE family protein [Lapidilactobacillus bayanensis]|uniref:sulfite exporter TauE/SafE family protein n=1 Tax=Lapidilactobacillus bayanensis TaxID=2485998 RepID=UPI000F792865|nr:sulfite exporter TauE/SafE family protein [Lapidilactobacillus bayanensis]
MLVANTIGAISGMGGGVIIKPLMDAVAQSPLSAINFYSSIAVFTMSIVSTYKQIRNGISVKWMGISVLSAGSVLGGLIGDKLFTILLQSIGEHGTNLIQIVIVIISLIVALIFVFPSHLRLTQAMRYIMLTVSGIFLGCLSTLLGIGGGPINMAILIFVFSMPPKTATAYSIATIIFSQFGKIVVSIQHLSSLHIQIDALPFILVAAVFGGYLGALLNKRIQSKTILIIYRIVVVFVILLNIWNGIRII